MLLGAPGSGKGTQAAYFSADFGVPVISSGDILRENIAKSTPFGIRAKEYIEKGELVPDDLVVDLIVDRFSHVDAKNGWLLDGFPRTENQAVVLDDILSKRGKKIDRVFLINVPMDDLINRIVDRLICPECGKIYNEKTMKPQVPGICDVDGVELIKRADDNIETAKNRIDVYNEQTKPLIDYYKSKDILTEVDGRIGCERIEDIIRETLG